MKSILRNTFALVAISFLSIAGLASAHDNPPPPGNQEHNGPGGDGGHHGPGEGQHHFGFMLTPTAAAPTGAAGWVAIHSDATASTLKIATRGLAAGTYTVNVTSKAGGSEKAFGTFAVAAPATTAGSTEDGDHAITEASIPFPTGFLPTDVASVKIADSTGAALLTGDNTVPTGTTGGADHCHQHFLLKATADAPVGATGRAEIEANDDAATPSASLKIETENLAAGTYTVNVTSLADGTKTAIGTFAVAAATGTSTETGTEATIAFPAGFNTKDVASVEVANAAGVALLTGDGSVRGGGLEGNEHLHEEIALTATTDALPGTKGEARIKAADHEGTTTAFLKLETQGLAAGTYTVKVTSAADGTVTVLGTFAAAASSTETDHAEFGTEAGLAFPTGFNPLDVATVQIADAAGIVLLTGDFSNVSAAAAANFTAKVRVTPGAAAPRAKGTATATSRLKRSGVQQTFTLAAKGVPASATLTVKVNGVTARTVGTTHGGRVLVGKLPKTIRSHKISSVTLETASGTRVLSAHF